LWKTSNGWTCSSSRPSSKSGDYHLARAGTSSTIRCHSSRRTASGESSIRMTGRRVVCALGMLLFFTVDHNPVRAYAPVRGLQQGAVPHPAVCLNTLGKSDRSIHGRKYIKSVSDVASPSCKLLIIKLLAESGGFEPPVELLVLQRFSKPPPSATRPTLHPCSLLRNSGSPTIAPAAHM
jgi:hypothetical protein